MAPLGNSTADMAAAAGDDQAVTGQVAFWAIVALALNAMAQSSTTTDIFFSTQSLFEGGLAPHMSSPIICLCDVLVELSLSAAVVRRRLRGLAGQQPGPDPTTVEDGPRGTAAGTQTDAPARAHVGPNIRELIGVRLVLFLFAVLPQAIKVFSMQGVPALQAVVATYLAAPLVRTVTTLLGEDYQDLKRDFRASLRRMRPAQPDEKPGPRWVRRISNHWPVIVRAVVRILHVAAYLVIWDQVFYLLSLQKGETFVQTIYIADSVTSWTVAVLALISAVWVLGSFFVGTMLVRVKWPNMSPGGFFIVACYLRTSMSVISGKDNTPGPWVLEVFVSVTRSLPLLLLASFCSILVESAVFQLSKVITIDTGGSDEHEIFNMASTSHGMNTNLAEESSQSPTEERDTVSTTEDSAHPSAPISSAEVQDTQQSLFPGEDIQQAGVMLRNSSHDEASMTSNDQASSVAPSTSLTTAETADSIRDKTPIHLRWRLEDNPIDQMIVCGVTSFMFLAGILYITMGSANRPDGDKLSNLTYGGWVAIAAQFSAFRRLVPAALLYAWKTGSDGPHSHLRNRARYFFRTLGVAMAFFFAQLILWLVFGLCKLLEVETSVSFVGRKLEYLKRKRAWNLFAIYNLVTAATYFFFAFDGTGTVNPPWTSFLG